MKLKKVRYLLCVCMQILCLSTTVFAEGYNTKPVPDNNSFKAYMGYTAITSRTSPQYKLQQQATTGSYGIRMYDGRYCIAVGTYYTSTIGTKIDVVMKNGNVIKCIVGDIKANCHTDATNRANPNGCVVEFIVDTKTMDPTCKRMGDMSYAPSGGLQGEIESLRVYFD